MEDLATLSNDEIRIRLVEYGFQNLPVTQTTRKVLVKKLSNAMEAQKNKNRRETVAVIKSSDDEDIEESRKAGKREKTPNRRATIGVVEKTKKAAAVTSSSNGSNTRAETPNKAISTTSSTSRRSSRATPQKVVTSSVQEDSDDNDVIIVRRSKTPTISKSETVRTSYKSTVEKVPEKITEDEHEEIFHTQRSTNTRRKTFAAPEIIEKPIARTVTPTKLSTRSTLTTSFNPSGTYDFNKTVGYDYDDEDDVYKLENTPYLSNFAKRLSTLKAEPIDIGLDKYKNKLHSEDDYSGNKYDSSKFKYSQRALDGIKRQHEAAARVQQQKQRDSFVNQMARDYNKLDKKYSVRKYVYIALLIMIIIAIYVLLFV